MREAYQASRRFSRTRGGLSCAILPAMAGPEFFLNGQWNKLTGEQRVAVGVFGVLAVVVLTFSAMQVRSSLIRPFTSDIQSLVDLQNALGPTEAELMREQQRTDTDGDGVSDYDESTKYFTSPYLRDSDSDGDADNVEIARGADPNCPKGRTCGAVETGTEVASGTQPGFIPPPVGVNGSFGEARVPQEALAIPPRDASAIRAYLEASGVPASELANYTDAQLLDAYDQSASEFQEDEVPAL